MRANTVEMFVDANTEKNPDQIFKIDICNTLRWASRSGMNITRINEGLRIDKKSANKNSLQSLLDDRGEEDARGNK